jgi:hypothetical protein
MPSATSFSPPSAAFCTMRKSNFPGSLASTSSLILSQTLVSGLSAPNSEATVIGVAARAVPARMTNGAAVAKARPRQKFRRASCGMMNLSSTAFTVMPLRHAPCSLPQWQG